MTRTRCRRAGKQAAELGARPQRLVTTFFRRTPIRKIRRIEAHGKFCRESRHECDRHPARYFLHVPDAGVLLCERADRAERPRNRRLAARCNGRGPAVDPSWSKWPPSAPTSPHWYRLAELERLAGAFLSHDRERRTIRVLRDFLAQFDGLSGTVKRKGVLEALDLQRASMDRLLLRDRDEFDHDLVHRLLRAMQAATRLIRPKALGPLGRDNIAASFRRWGGDPATYRYKMITGDDYGVPWVVEAAMACLPSGRPRKLLCGVNWSPGLNDPFRLGFQLGKNFCGPGEPVVILAHLVCPRPEFVDRGKRTLAGHSPGYESISAVVEVVTADWERQRRSEIRDRKRELKRMENMRVREAIRLSLKDLVIKHLPRVIAITSENGRLSFTQRDLFYAIRPLVQQEQDKPLAYSYFTGLLTDWEAERGEIAGLQREPRGSLYHPHRREEIPLSTETVARYARPFWTINKLVYIEKAGTQQNLIEVGWPQEHDCAIASVGGFTTRAIKDLLDMLATSSEPITVFCVHDAAGAGTMIYHTLVNETTARGARKIEIVNLGLEPWEGVAMLLEVEPVEGGDRRRAVASTTMNGGLGLTSRASIAGPTGSSATGSSSTRCRPRNVSRGSPRRSNAIRPARLCRRRRSCINSASRQRVRRSGRN
jgi:hypothetical protein